MDILLWIVALIAITVGLLGTIVPALPGAPLIFGGVFLAAWIDQFSRIGWPTLTVLGVLAALSFIIDILASVLGAQRVGASKLALIGATIGSVLGIFGGILGILIGPFLGAFVGEVMSGSHARQAGKVGFATWIGLLIGTVLKVGVSLSMLGVFIFGLLL